MITTPKLSDVEIVSLLAPESAPFGLVAADTVDQIFNLRSFYPGSLQHETLRRENRFITPINLAAIPNFLRITLSPEPESAAMIARHTTRFVDDGATIRMGLGALHRAIIIGLSEKNSMFLSLRFY